MRGRTEQNGMIFQIQKFGQIERPVGRLYRRQLICQYQRPLLQRSTHRPARTLLHRLLNNSEQHKLTAAVGVVFLPDKRHQIVSFGGGEEPGGMAQKFQFIVFG